MRSLLVAILYLLGTGMAVRSTTYAACLFLWNDIFRPTEFAHMGGRFPVAYYVLFVLVGSYALQIFRGRLSPNAGWFVWLLAGFILWILVTAVASPFRSAALTEYVLYLKYLLPLLLIYSSVQSMKDVKILVIILCLSVGVWAAAAGVHCLIKGPTTDLGIRGGQMGERNEFAAGIVSTVPLWIYFFFSYAGRFRRSIRALCALVAFLSVAAVLLSLSRGASIGLFVSLLAYLAFVSKRKIRDSALTLVVAAIGLVFAPKEWYERMQTIEIGSEQTEGSAKERMDSMTGALMATLDRPVTGWGPDGWLQVAKFYAKTENNPHSIYLKLSSETGLVGLVFYLVIMLFTYLQIKSVVNLAARHGDKDSGRLAMALATGILGYLAASTFLNRPLHEFLWSWITVANAFAVIYPRALKRRQNAMAKAKAGAARPPAPSAAGPESAPGAKPAPGPDIAAARGALPGWAWT